MRKNLDFGSLNCFDFENNVKALACEELAPGVLNSLPVFIVDPCQAGITPLRTASIQLIGATRQSSSFDGQSTGPLAGLATYPARMNFTGGGFALQLDLQHVMLNSTSGTNTAQTLAIDSRNLNKTLAISMTTSAGTATLSVTASPDNVTFLTIDSVAAAGTTVKQYTETTVGGTTALSPLSFRYINITAGTAGVGNTTQLLVGLK